MRAFPTDVYYDEKVIGQHEGMQLRDYFAAHVVAGFHSSLRCDSEESWPSTDQMARYAYEMADAMVNARRPKRAKT